METVAQLLPFAIAGAFLPTWTSYVILLLGTERPMTSSSAYVAGNATWRFGLGFAAIFLVSATAPAVEQDGLVIPVPAAWVLASLLGGMGLWLLTRRPKTDSYQAGNLPKWLQALKRLPPWAAFGYAVYNCAMPGAQWVYFLGGCTVIASSGLAWEWRMLLLALFIAVLETMLVTPIVIYARRRERAKATFDRLDRWLARHATTVFGGILTMIGGLFAYIAMSGGRIGGGG